MRQILIVGNWKMNKTATEAVVYVKRFTELLASPAGGAKRVDVVLAPPFTALAAVKQSLSATPSSRPVAMGAQNLFWEEKGAFTGEVAASMLTDLGCQYVIIGHSERRQYFGETDESVNRKVHTALRHGLRPILCIGESLAEREQDRTEAVVTKQLQAALTGVTAEHGRQVVMAYEPVWAIGTGHAASPKQATEVHGRLRALLREQWRGVAADVPILYGGSVTPENAGGFLAAEEVDGALVGGACLDPGSFAKIVALADSVSR
jgi:triosephosphate isomerase